jgi:NADP-dependent 3-hydroxy acid dehydrogenase YdfG
VVTALVTGGSSGIGRAIAERLAADGVDVLALGRTTERVAEVDAIAGVTGITLDITDHAAVADAIGDRDIDVLVCNAGVVEPLGPVHEADAADAVRAIGVNLTAHVALVHAVLPRMVAAGSGHVLVTGSTAGHAPVAGMAVYAATKAALGMFAQSLRLEVAPLGVRVTELVVGRTETDLYRDALSAEGRAAMYDGTFVQPQDVAATVAAVLAAPAHVDIGRVDVLPVQPGVTPPALR